MIYARLLGTESLYSGKRIPVPDHLDGEPPMPLEFACPQCRKSFSVDAALAGKKARCKKCAHEFRIPAPAVKAARPAPVAPAGDGYALAALRSGPAVERFDDPPPARGPYPERYGAPRTGREKRRRREMDQRFGWAVGAVGGATLVAVITMLLLWQAPPPRAHDERAALGLPFLVLAALFSLLACILDWDWFFENRKARLFVALLGRTGARVFYIILSGAILGVVAGIYTRMPPAGAAVAPAEADGAEASEPPSGPAPPTVPLAPRALAPAPPAIPVGPRTLPPSTPNGPAPPPATPSRPAPFAPRAAPPTFRNPPPAAPAPF